MGQLEEITGLLSQKRLDKYKGISKEDAFKCHLYNSELAESFYQSLSYFEIILRNKIDIVFSKYLGEDWILNPKYILGRNKDNMATALVHMKDTKKNPTDKNHIISELNLGFWVYLFLPIYENVIWKPYPQMLEEIFDKAKSKIILNKTFYRLNRIKMYRNKIFHYGSLLAITDELSNPAKMHNTIYSMLKDLSANKLLKEIKRIDTFNEKYIKGKKLGILK